MNIQSLIKTLFYKAGYSIKRIHPVARPMRASGSQRKTGSAGVRQLLHRIDPYEGFDFQAVPFDAHGWGGQSPAFREIIQEVKPHLIVEVGTWKGASALEMASIVRELGLETEILCIDTWLGALEFWTDQNDPHRYLSLQLRYGYPGVYYQFLANVCHRGFQDMVVPFPQTAATAALWLRHFGITAELVYVDASHEEEDVYQDLCSYWEVVSRYGVLFGDDYGWDGVRLAVDRFAEEQNSPLTFIADKWLLRKET